MFKRSPKKHVTYADEFKSSDTTPVTRRKRKTSGLISILTRLALLGGAAWLVVTFAGLPAVLWTYTYIGSKETRTDAICRYIRIDGTIHESVPAVDTDRCHWIAFFKVK